MDLLHQVRRSRYAHHPSTAFQLDVFELMSETLASTEYRTKTALCMHGCECIQSMFFSNEGSKFCLKRIWAGLIFCLSPTKPQSAVEQITSLLPRFTNLVSLISVKMFGFWPTVPELSRSHHRQQGPFSCQVIQASYRSVVWVSGSRGFDNVSNHHFGYFLAGCSTQ